MRTDIVEDLKSHYLKHRQSIHKLLGNEKMKDVCDDYYKEQLGYPEISLKIGTSTSDVKRTMVVACGLIIRNRHRMEYHV